MGPPPNFLITRKLIRHFFRKYLPNEPITRGNETQDLADSIARFGIDHPNTMLAVDKLDAAEAEAKRYRARVEALKIQQKVMCTLKTPQYHFNQKGRYRNDLFPKEWTIYDGVK